MTAWLPTTSLTCILLESDKQRKPANNNTLSTSFYLTWYLHILLTLFCVSLFTKLCAIPFFIDVYFAYADITTLNVLNVAIYSENPATTNVQFSQSPHQLHFRNFWGLYGIIMQAWNSNHRGNNSSTCNSTIVQICKLMKPTENAHSVHEQVKLCMYIRN